MAGTEFSCPVPSTALVASTPKTVIFIKAAENINLRLKGFEFWFDGISGSDQGVLIEIVKGAANGTGTSGTPVVSNLSGATVQGTYIYNCTVEPTGLTVIKSMRIHPQGGIISCPLTDQLMITEDTYLGFRLTSPTNKNVVGTVQLEE